MSGNLILFSWFLYTRFSNRSSIFLRLVSSIGSALEHTKYRKKLLQKQNFIWQNLSRVNQCRSITKRGYYYTMSQAEAAPTAAWTAIRLSTLSAAGTATPESACVAISSGAGRHLNYNIVSQDGQLPPSPKNKADLMTFLSIILATLQKTNLHNKK